MIREVGQARAGESANSGAGFTIIEVVLFLAISGMLVVALLGTVGLAVQRQRTTDAITSTQAFVQSQYDESLNVVNDRLSGGCSSGAGGTSLGGGAGSQRGASGCVVLGKALDFTTGSTRITTYNVIGSEPTPPSGLGGSALLAKYTPVVDSNSALTYDIPWGSEVKVVRRVNSSEHVNRVLVLRSPDSGTMLTFGVKGGDNIQGALSEGAGTFDVCIDSPDMFNGESLVALSSVAGASGVSTQFYLDSAAVGSLC